MIDLLLWIERKNSSEWGLLVFFFHFWSVFAVFTAVLVLVKQILADSGTFLAHFEGSTLCDTPVLG